jgi:hypothetical protein
LNDTVRTVGHLRIQTGEKKFIFRELLFATLITLNQYSTQTRYNTKKFYRL